MQLTSRKILAALAIFSGPAPALAENQTLTCWYNERADFTSASAAPGGSVGAVAKAGSGNKTYSYTITARDGSACPVQLPLSTQSAVTVALIENDDSSCANENVMDTSSATVGGSVTVSHATSQMTTAAIKLAGLAPNTSYKIYLKCVRQLGSLRTDAGGSAGRTVDFMTETVGSKFAFEIYADGADQGPKFQSLTFSK